MSAIGQDDKTQSPIGSMYGILFTYIWLIFMVNVCKYGIHGCYGFTSHQCFFFTENSSSRPFVVDSLECTRQVLVHNLRYPLRLTCNLRIHPWKRTIIFQTMIFRFYVNILGCMHFYLNIQGQMSYCYCCQPLSSAQNLQQQHSLRVTRGKIPSFFPVKTNMRKDWWLICLCVCVWINGYYYLTSYDRNENEN